MNPKTFLFTAAICFMICTPFFITQASSPIEKEDTDIDQIDFYSPPTNIRTAAEWERSEEVLLRWGGGGLDNYYLEITREVVEVATAQIVTNSQSSADSISDYLESNGVNMGNVSFFIVDTDSIWMRDYGPISVIDESDGNLSFVNMMYDRFGRWDDDSIPWRYGQASSTDWYNMTDGDRWFRLEGGNVIVDGAGIFYTTDRCFEQNHPSHGGDLYQEEVVEWATDYFSLQRFRNVTRLSNDGTGHIDMQIKLLNETAVMISEVPSNDPDYEILEYNARYFENRTARNGQPYEVIRIPLEKGGWSTHYTYTNSLTVNNKVLVPIYGRSTDTQALQIYEEAMPGYDIVGIDSSDIISSNGAIHCTTMQVAAENIPPSIEILDVTHRSHENVTIQASVTDDSAVTSAELYYNSTEDDTLTKIRMDPVRDDNTYEAVLPVYPDGTIIRYFIRAEDDFKAISYDGDIWDMHEFTVGSPPEINITSPVIDDSWDAGSVHEIRWNITPGNGVITSVDIEYSIDHGAYWYDLVDGVDDTGTYPWEVPDHHTEYALIRLTAHDSNDLTTTEVSGRFEIVGEPPMAPEDIDVDHFVNEGNYTYSEIRYLRSDSILGEENTETGLADEFTGSGGQSFYVGVRVFVNNSTTEFELTEGSAVGIVERVDDGEGYQTATWTPPEVELSTSDSITVEVYGDCGVDPPTSLIDTFSTEELGANVLNAEPWTINYYTYRSREFGTTTGRFEWGSEERNSRIENISYTVTGENHTEDNIITWNASPDDPDKVTHYGIYRSMDDDVSGPYEKIAQIDADGGGSYEYLDQGKGAADPTLWWYKVYSMRGELQGESVGPAREPGGNITSMDIHLTSDGDGWNFVSFPLMLEDTSIESILDDPNSGIHGNYTKVLYYDSSEERWFSYVDGRSDRFNDLNHWNHHMGMWIQMETSDTLTIEGHVPDKTSITLNPGWNMVGIPSSQSGNHDLPEEVTKVGHHNASLEYNIEYVDAVDFIFEPNQGYWLYNSAEDTITWTVGYR